MTPNIEQTILRNLLHDEQYMRKVIPFIKPDYFQGVYKTLFKEVGKYIGKYNKLPTQETLVIELETLNEEQYNMSMDIVPHLFTNEPIDENWLNVKIEQSIMLLWNQYLLLMVSMKV